MPGRRRRSSIRSFGVRELGFFFDLRSAEIFARARTPVGRENVGGTDAKQTRAASERCIDCHDHFHLEMNRRQEQRGVKQRQESEAAGDQKEEDPLCRLAGDLLRLLDTTEVLRSERLRESNLTCSTPRVYLRRRVFFAVGQSFLL